MFNNYIKNNYVILISLFWIIIWGSINTFPPNTESIKNIFCLMKIIKILLLML